MRGMEKHKGKKLCFPLQASQDSHKWNACHKQAHGQKEHVQNSWISSWDPGDLCSLDLTLIILDLAHTIKHNLFPLLKGVVNIYLWYVHVFQGPFSKLAADLTQMPRTPLCCPFIKRPWSRAVNWQCSSPDCCKHSLYSLFSCTAHPPEYFTVPTATNTTPNPLPAKTLLK